MELHQEHFHQNITFLAPKLQNNSEFDNNIEEVRFAMGFIFGIFEENVEIRTLKDFSEVSKIGKSGEEAYADQYAIFYKSGRFLHYEQNSIFPRSECDWTVDIPQGFSCGKREMAKDDCPDEKFVSMECSNIVINVE